MLKRSCTLAALVLLVLAAAAQARSPLGVGAAEPALSDGGLFGSLFAWINAWQQSFYRGLTGALKAIREDPPALVGLVGLSFAYGVFHAAGPGHGKAVISSYMIANEVQLKRGVLISFLSALMQGVVAIVLVGATYFVLRGSGITMTTATRALEIASFALIALFGLWLLLKKIAALRRRPLASPVMAIRFDPPADRLIGRFQAVEVDDHQHYGAESYCQACGKSHLPPLAALGQPRFRLREAWSAILAVGLRPCSGAILVLGFSLLNGLYIAGLLSVLAMSLGTAITVAALAILAVTAKDLAIRFAGAGSAKSRWLTNAIEIGGALFVLTVGLSLLGASLQTGGANG